MNLQTLRAELICRFRDSMHNARINRAVGRDSAASYHRYLAREFMQRVQAIDTYPETCLVFEMDTRALLMAVRPIRHLS